MKPSPALFLAAALAAPAPVVILPRAATVLEGRSCAFHLALPSGARVAAADWRWTLARGPGTLDPATGVYTAPAVTQPHTVKIQAIYQPFPGLAAEAALLVLPHQPFDIVGKVLGPGWAEPLPGPYPFLNPATGQRPAQDQCNLWNLWNLWNVGARTCHVGYGLPLTLAWTAQPWAQATVLSYGRGPDQVQQDVSGQREQVILATGAQGDYTVESMCGPPDGGGQVQSLIQRGAIRVRGLLPYVGNPVAEPGHDDGKGLEARFQAPFGLATFLETRPSSMTTHACLVADSQSHVIRRIDEDGRVTTPWGQPYVAGHLDAAPPSGLRSWARYLCPRVVQDDRIPPSLFNRPTFLLVSQDYVECWRWIWTCRVADSGNHVIRTLYPDGRVTTLAGIPGSPGHYDSWYGSLAQFHDPQGLAEGTDGTLYVADRGNCVIRTITTRGSVGTLAGSPGQAGTRDGTAGEARFSQLRGLALARTDLQGEELFAADGHAIRKITLPRGEVTTVLGAVASPGFREVLGGTAAERRVALAQPCLRAPCGLLTIPQGLLIADRGNHAVREWCAAQATLTTLAGDPAQGATRWGLARDGLASPLDERYAALAAPSTLAAAMADLTSLYVTTGACLGDLRTGREGLARLGSPALDCPPAQAGEPCVIRLAATAHTVDGTAVARPLYCQADFLEADGTLAQTVKVDGSTGTPMSFQGALQQRGRGRVRVRCVTAEGVSAEASAELVVR